MQTEAQTDTPDPAAPKKPRSNLQRAIWRGSSIIAPPLVTLLVLIWLVSAIEQYVLLPLESAGRAALVWTTADVMQAPPAGVEIDPGVNGKPDSFSFGGLTYVKAPMGGKFLPENVVTWVDYRLDMLPSSMQNPLSASNYYQAYIKLRYMPRQLTIPLLLVVLLCVLFFVGRFLAAGVGRFFVTAFERVINQLPLVRNLYSSVKQVTDFVLSEREIEFTRVVAIEYPRVGIWSLGFVTSDSLPSLKASLGEEIIAVFIPTSPMPMTGFTVNIRRREAIDMELTIDQAIQFIVSCGVVIPPSPAARLRGSNPVLLSDAPPATDNS